MKRKSITNKDLVTYEQACALDKLGFDRPAIFFSDGNDVDDINLEGVRDVCVITDDALSKFRISNPSAVKVPFKIDAIDFLERKLKKKVLYIPLGDNYFYPVIIDWKESIDLIKVLEEIESGVSFKESINLALNFLLNISLKN